MTETTNCSTCKISIPHPDNENQLESFECLICEFIFCIKCIPHNEWNTDEAFSLCPICYSMGHEWIMKRLNE